MKKLMLGLLLYAGLSMAHAWAPTGQVQLVVPFPPGGSTDVIGRIIADGLNANGIENIVVVNRPGAGGVIGTNYVINSTADGHTLLLTGTSFLFNKLQKTPGADYDPVNGMSHVGLIGIVPNHLYARSSLGQKNVVEVIKSLRQGKQYAWGVTNPGAEFTAQLLAQKLGIKLVIVSYKGSAPAIQDLAGGHIDFVIDSGSSEVASGLVFTGKIRLIAVLNSKKESANTIDEHVNGVVTQSWFGLSLPKGTNDKIVEFYNTALNKVLNDPKIQQKLQKNSVQPVGGVSQIFKSQINTDFKTYTLILDKNAK
jgi:tripartite-type tricarboxylate transporter receptor subunit TctC